MIVVAEHHQTRDALGEALRPTGYTCGLHDRISAAATELATGGVACVLIEPGPAADAVEGIRILLRTNPRLRVIVVGGGSNGPASAEPRPEFLLSAVRAGARDFLAWPVETAVLVEAIRAQFERADAELTPERAAPPKALDDLSEREREVLGWVVRGHSTKQIASELGRVEKTVEYHRKRIMDKLGVSTAVQLVRLVTLCGWTAEQSLSPPRAEAVR